MTADAKAVIRPFGAPLDVSSGRVKMAISEMKQFLLWSTAINYGILFVWFGAFIYAHDWLYRTHTRWFRLAVETFDTLHYAGVAIYKIGILLLNLVPLLVLSIIS